MKKFQELQTPEHWNAVKRQLSKCTHGAIVLKYSPRCPISRSVERSFDRWYGQLAEDVSLLCAKIDVIQARSLSQQIAAELNIRHESPQAIWLTPTRTIQWHASHRTITPDSLTAQLRHAAACPD